MPNQEQAFSWPFGNGPVRVGTQGLFRLCLKTFVTPFNPARLTAPGSPRMLATQLSRFTLWHNGRRASQLARKFTLRHTTDAELNNPIWCMYQESHAFSKEKYEGVIQSKISLRVWTFSELLKDERFGRFIKHRSIVELQQALKNVRFTKIQHTFKRWTIYEDRIADLSKRLKDERRGRTNHHVS